MKPRQDIHAEVPPDLAAVDEALAKFGRWAAERGRGRRRCGSAEGLYQREAPRGSDLGPGMSTEEALACQRALAGLPKEERVVLTVLYVRQRLPPEAQLRILRIPPKLSQERHLLGLRMLANLLRRDT